MVKKQERQNDMVVILRDAPGNRIEIWHNSNEGKFIILHNYMGRVEVIDLSTVEFIHLLKNGLEHFGLSNGVVEKLASKLVQ